MAIWQPDPHYEQPPARLGVLLNLVLGDLQGGEPIAVQVGWDPEHVWSDQLMRGEQVVPTPMLMFSEPGLRGGVGWTPAEPEVAAIDDEWSARRSDEELAVDLADCLQEQFFPETAAAWGQARPPCPGHSHPAVALLIDGEAWWTCPLEGSAIARFGESSRT